MSLTLSELFPTSFLSNKALEQSLGEDFRYVRTGIWFFIGPIILKLVMQ